MKLYVAVLWFNECCAGLGQPAIDPMTRVFTKQDQAIAWADQMFRSLVASFGNQGRIYTPDDDNPRFSKGSRAVWGLHYAPWDRDGPHDEAWVECVELDEATE